MYHAAARNRLDACLKFNPLSPQVMERIVDKFVRGLSAQPSEGERPPEQGRNKTRPPPIGYP
jgi:ATP-dependent Clp protease ATP-binding subunit ClpA